MGSLDSMGIAMGAPYIAMVRKWGHSFDVAGERQRLHICNIQEVIGKHNATCHPLLEISRFRITLTVRQEVATDGIKSFAKGFTRI